MKKQILEIALIAAILGSIATGCSSQKKAGTTDTTMKDTSKVATPAATPVDTMKKDTTKKDTTHH
jgi:hypothetical protein